MGDDSSKEINWSSQLEDIIAQEGEKCRGLAWIHQKAEMKVSTRNNYIQLPVIVLSTLCGTASVGSSSLFGGSSVAPTVIGLVSIGVGILNTLGNYFDFAKKSESHRIAHLHYSKLFSQINVEMSLPREERSPPAVILKTLRDTMERLAETTPSVPQEIIKQFNDEFEEYKGKVSIPAECNGLSKITVFRDETEPKSKIKITILPPEPKKVKPKT
jgi:hypothetical protein